MVPSAGPLFDMADGFALAGEVAVQVAPRYSPRELRVQPLEVQES